jgi:hypothetical protein
MGIINVQIHTERVHFACFFYSCYGLGFILRNLQRKLCLFLSARRRAWIF